MSGKPYTRRDHQMRMAIANQLVALILNKINHATGDPDNALFFDGNFSTADGSLVVDIQLNSRVEYDIKITWGNLWIQLGLNQNQVVSDNTWFDRFDIAKSGNHGDIACVYVNGKGKNSLMLEAIEMISNNDFEVIHLYT